MPIFPNHTLSDSAQADTRSTPRPFNRRTRFSNMMTRFRRLPSRSALPLAIGVLLVCSVGCGKTGTVKGIVKQADGTPLPGGLIMFAPEEAGKSAATGVIKEDGTYEVEVPKGAFKVSIDNRAAGQVETLVGVGSLTGSAAGKGPGGTNMAGPPAARNSEYAHACRPRRTTAMVSRAPTRRRRAQRFGTSRRIGFIASPEATETGGPRGGTPKSARHGE